MLMIQFSSHSILFFFFFNDTATTEIYTLSLHDALPIWAGCRSPTCARRGSTPPWSRRIAGSCDTPRRSEEHTSELQSLAYLVCRLLLEKKKIESYQSRRLPHAQFIHRAQRDNIQSRLNV